MAVVQREKARLTVASLVLAWFLPGCAIGPLRAPSAKISTAGGASVTQSGDAQTPAAVTVSAETRTLPIPAGSVVVLSGAPGPLGSSGQETPAPVSVKLSRDSEFRVVSSSERAEAPRAFVPPAPPTPDQVAAADGVRWFWLASLVGLVASGLLAWRAHVLAAVCVGAGAAALPLLARFYSSDLALPVAVGLVAVGLGVFVAWHILARRHSLKE